MITNLHAAAARQTALRGSIFYDGECRFCRSLARRFDPVFVRRGFDLKPFPTSGIRRSEMRVETADGGDFGGAKAVVFLARQVWWGLPLFWFSKFPGAAPLLHRLYREIAARRSCLNGACRI